MRSRFSNVQKYSIHKCVDLGIIVFCISDQESKWSQLSSDGEVFELVQLHSLDK